MYIFHTSLHVKARKKICNGMKFVWSVRRILIFSVFICNVPKFQFDQAQRLCCSWVKLMQLTTKHQLQLTITEMFPLFFLMNVTSSYGTHSVKESMLMVGYLLKVRKFKAKVTKVYLLNTACTHHILALHNQGVSSLSIQK